MPESDFGLGQGVRNWVKIKNSKIRYYNTIYWSTLWQKFSYFAYADIQCF